MDLANFRSRVIAELEAATYPDYISDSPKEVAEDVSQYLRFVIAAQMEEGAPESLGGSRIGGHPDLPEGLAWPVEGDDEDLEPLAFLCQINLADVHPHDLEGVMPASGMLWFFSIADGDRAYSYEIDDSTTKVLYQKEAGALVRREAPEDTEVIAEFQLAFGPSFLLEEEQDGVLGLMRFDSAIETAVDTAIQNSGGKVGSLRMLGNAYFFDEENEDAFNPESEVVLLEVDGYSVASEFFGEGGFTWTIGRKALADGELESAWLIFEQGT